jgi:hypothetical protein
MKRSDSGTCLIAMVLADRVASSRATLSGPTLDRRVQILVSQRARLSAPTIDHSFRLT